MSFTIENAANFTALMAVLGEVAEEAVFHITPQGLHIQALSTPQTSGVVIDYKLTNNNTEQTFGVKIADLLKILKIHKKTVDFHFAQNNLEIVGNNRAHSLRHYDPQYIKEMPRLPEEGKIKVDIQMEEFKSMIQDAGMFTPCIEFATLNNILAFTGKDDGIQNVASATFFMPNKVEITKTIYNAELLSPIFNLGKQYSDLRVAFDKDYPLRLTVKNDVSSMTLLVAPRANT